MKQVGRIPKVLYHLLHFSSSCTISRAEIGRGSRADAGPALRGDRAWSWHRKARVISSERVWMISAGVRLRARPRKESTRARSRPIRRRSQPPAAAPIGLSSLLGIRQERAAVPARVFDDVDMLFAHICTCPPTRSSSAGSAGAAIGQRDHGRYQPLILNSSPRHFSKRSRAGRRIVDLAVVGVCITMKFGTSLACVQ